MKMSQAKWIPGKTTMNGSTISSNQYVSTDYALNKTVCTVYRELEVRSYLNVCITYSVTMLCTLSCLLHLSNRSQLPTD